jgi:glucose-1-phosphate thymidylyltransferase
MTSVRPATTRAVILARGLGTRMRRNDDTRLTPEQARAAEAGAKAMFPVGRPFLDYVLSALADAGITDVCIVVAPNDTALQHRYRDELDLERLHIVFAFQREPKGTANALLAARDFARDANVLVLNADNYYPVEVVRALSALGSPGVPGFDAKALVELGHIDAERVRAYALLQVDTDGYLIDIVEKPDAATFDRLGDAPVSMNLWSTPPAIFDACDRVAPSARGELELPDAVRIAVRNYQVKFKVLPFALGVLDLSGRADVPAITARLQGTPVRL